MRRKGVILLFGLIVVVSGWWITRSDSLAQPQEGVVDVWATWGDEADPLQSLLDRFSRSSGVPIRVTTRAKSDELREALGGAEPPDMVILSSGDLVGAYGEQGLVEPLDRWIEASGIDLEDIYPAPLAQCQGLDGGTLCLPWGCDIDALFWNKDLFEAAGLDPERPPQTMEEMAEYASKLTVRDGDGELSQVGFIPDFPRSQADLFARMFGGALYGEEGGALAVNGQAVIDALTWQKQFYTIYAPEELSDFISSFTPYMTSRHAMYAGRRLDCRQCHRALPIQKKRIPDAGFHQGRIAMMIDGEWQASRHALSREGQPVNYGVAPFPPPSAHPERARTAVVQGPVLFIPAGAKDKEAAARLLAWMMSPEIVAEEAFTTSTLPTSRTAARDPRFLQIPGFSVFMELLAHPNARAAPPSPFRPELNAALGQVEAELLHEGGDAVRLLNEVQAEFAPRLEEALSYRGKP
jgi:multiple sugar transport system substrate-binding protein